MVSPRIRCDVVQASARLQDIGRQDNNLLPGPFLDMCFGEPWGLQFASKIGVVPMIEEYLLKF